MRYGAKEHPRLQPLFVLGRCPFLPVGVLTGLILQTVFYIGYIEIVQTKETKLIEFN